MPSFTVNFEVAAKHDTGMSGKLEDGDFTSKYIVYDLIVV